MNLHVQLIIVQINTARRLKLVITRHYSTKCAMASSNNSSKKSVGANRYSTTDSCCGMKRGRNSISPPPGYGFQDNETNGRSFPLRSVTEIRTMVYCRGDTPEDYIKLLDRVMGPRNFVSKSTQTELSMFGSSSRANRYAPPRQTSSFIPATPSSSSNSLLTSADMSSSSKPSWKK